MNYYDILGVSMQADEKQIKQAYRKLAKKYHPDLNPDNPEAEIKFREITEAYETLTNLEKRKEYDASLMPSHATVKTGAYKQNRAYGAGTSSGVNFGNFTKDMEKYFGFSFNPENNMEKQNTKNSTNKKNPLDVTEMFEAFMKIK